MSMLLKNRKIVPFFGDRFCFLQAKNPPCFVGSVAGVIVMWKSKEDLTLEGLFQFFDLGGGAEAADRIGTRRAEEGALFGGHIGHNVAHARGNALGDRDVVHIDAVVGLSRARKVVLAF